MQLQIKWLHFGQFLLVHQLEWRCEKFKHEHLDLFLQCKWGRVRISYLVEDLVLQEVRHDTMKGTMDSRYTLSMTLLILQHMVFGFGLLTVCYRVATPLWAKCEDETHTPKSGNLESSRTPATLELDRRGKNTSP